MEPAELETSIGTVYVRVQARDQFTIEGPFETPWAAGACVPDYAYPHVDLRFDARDGAWVNVRTAFDYRDPAMDKASIPGPLLAELSKLGSEWANAHPEKFERAARAEFDDLIMEMADETFDEIARICSDAAQRFRRILIEEPEFQNYASTALRRRVQKEAQRLRILRSQAAGAAKAINSMAGRRPLGQENHSTEQPS